MEIAFIEQLDALDKLVVNHAPVGTIRNFISSLREQAEAEAKRAADLLVTNQKIVAEHAQLEAEHAKLKAQQLEAESKIMRSPGIKPYRGMGMV